MISSPKYGWCNFDLGDFHGRPSYLTDVPFDLLQAFIDLHTKGSGCVWFDEEGTEFTLVLNPYSIFVIEEKDEPILHDCFKIKIGDIEKEFINDIESDLNGWAEFITDDDREEIMVHRNEIRNMVIKLKEFL